MDDVFARYQACLRSGHQLAAEGRYKDALSQYQEAARVAGERALPHIGIGSMLLRLGKPREALAAYERALALEPDSLDGLTGRAAALLAAGRRADAAVVQQHIMALRESPPSMPAVPAELATPLSRAETLAVAGEQARDNGDDDSAVEAWLAEARELATESRYDAALDAALRALALDTGAPRVHVELARIYSQRGWAERAAQHVASLRRLLDLAPDPAVMALLDELERDLVDADSDTPPPLP